MRFTPEVLSILGLRIVPLTLLTSLAFGAVSTVFSAPLTAQTRQDIPTTVPSLSGYDSETRQSMELACVSQNVKGPVAYGACLNRQIASLQSSSGIPSLSGYDSETRQSMELACVSQNVKGPVAYGACLNRQIASLQSSPGIPSLSGYDSETRQSMELACVSQNVKGPVAYGAVPKSTDRFAAKLPRYQPEATNGTTYFKEWRNKFGQVKNRRFRYIFRKRNRQIHHRERYENSWGNRFR